MYKYILANGGESINWMALFSLLTFFFLFVISAIAIWGRSKAYIQHMEALPLDEDTIQ
ncbi:MAG: cbb3-type cytochrome c oxidase subunit 3 [Bacteroidota bacterium]